MATTTYSGSFGGNKAGSSGISATATGNPIPSGMKIDSVRYSIYMTSGGYSSSNDWVVHWFSVGGQGGSPSASGKSYQMTSNSQTISGSMSFVSSDVSKFSSSSITIHAKVNTDHSSTSYMHNFTITVTYSEEGSSSGGGSTGGGSSGTTGFTPATGT